MSIIKFLTGKIFLKNLIAAILLIVVIIFGLKLYLNVYTHHNEYHLVPDLSKKSFEDAKKILTDRKMNIVIVDTVDYNPKFPKYSVVEQNPRKDDKVKVGRKIYVKLNNSAYAKVSLPNIFGKTQRQAVALLKASGLRPGKITKRPYFAEVVLYAIHQKDTLKSGQKIPKTSVVNLIIGDGKRPVDAGEPVNSNKNSADKDIQNIINNVVGN